MADKQQVGVVVDYLDHIGVAIVELSGTLRVGDNISIEGPHTNFTQAVSSMQMQHASVQKADKGDSIGMKVVQGVKKKDTVFKL